MVSRVTITVSFRHCLLSCHFTSPLTLLLSRDDVKVALGIEARGEMSEDFDVKPNFQAFSRCKGLTVSGELNLCKVI